MMFTRLKRRPQYKGHLPQGFNFAKSGRDGKFGATKDFIVHESARIPFKKTLISCHAVNRQHKMLIGKQNKSSRATFFICTIAVIKTAVKLISFEKE